MATVRLDTSEVERMRMDLKGAPTRAQLRCGRAVSRGAGLVNERMTELSRGHRRLPKYAIHVSDEMVGPMEAEIGLEYKGQGMLAHIIVYGSVNNAPVYDHAQSLYQAMPAIAQMIAEAGQESVFGGAK